MVKVKLLHPNARIPTRNTDLDAGADLYSVEETLIAPHSRAFIDTGIALQAENSEEPILTVITKNDASLKLRSYFRIAPRSGLAFKNGIDVLAGVVDLGYTNSIKVGLYNTSDEPFQVTKGMKVAQIIREICVMDSFFEIAELQTTERGLKGFGSSGV